MLKVDAGLIKAAQAEVNNYGYEPVDIRAKYSGRAMYGDDCFGVTGNEIYLQEFENILALMYVTDGNLGAEVEAYDVLQALADFRDTRRQDNMGLSTIFYYPGIEVEGELEDTEYESEYYG